MSSHQNSLQPFRWQYDEFDDGNFQLRGRTLFFILIIFSVILLVTLLFIYARWVCRFAPPPPPSSAAPPPPRGLDMATINSMPIVLYRKSTAAAGDACFGDGECCICLGIFGEKETVKVLPFCRHCFHSECVDMWLKAQSSCPVCRASLRVDSIV